MRISTHKRRRAISPVLATVILIAITLIAAIAIAGFVFGLFGSFTSSAQVSATTTRCHDNGNGTATCTLSVNNSGTSNVSYTACNLRISGSPVSGTPQGVKTFNAGTSGSVSYCRAAGAGGSVGSQETGSMTLSNGASVPFSGVWS